MTERFPQNTNERLSATMAVTLANRGEADTLDGLRDGRPPRDPATRQKPLNTPRNHRDRRHCYCCRRGLRVVVTRGELRQQAARDQIKGRRRAEAGPRAARAQHLARRHGRAAAGDTARRDLHFDRRRLVQNEAWLSVGQTCFVCVILGFGVRKVASGCGHTAERVLDVTE